MAFDRHDRKYLDDSFRPTRWNDIEPVLIELLQRSLPDSDALRRWLRDWSETEDAIDEAGVWREIAKDQDIHDQNIQQAYLSWKEGVEPHVKRLLHKLQVRLMDHPAAAELHAEEPVFLKRMKNQVDLFCQGNNDLQARCDRLVSDFFVLRGRQEQACKWTDLEEDVRRSTFEQMVDRRAEDYGAVDTILDALLEIRHQIANAAGCDDFRAFRWRELNRLDYTPEDCLKIVEAVKEYAVPRLRKADEYQASELGHSGLHPWDARMEPVGAEPLKPFGETDKLLSGVREIVDMIDPVLTKSFDFMLEENLLDLHPRKGKSDAVGYCQILSERRAGFIFKNVKPAHRDLEVMMHEFGHAFHVLACRNHELRWDRQILLEFSEAVANGIQFIAGCFWGDTFYDQQDAKRARLYQIHAIVENLVYTARGEAFLHWLHTTPGHTRQQRRDKWVELDSSIGRDLDWSGYEHHRSYTWVYEIPHLFFSPFYWIEYMYGQLGGIQLCRNFRENPDLTMSRLRHAMSLGSSVALPDLFGTAGISFRMDSMLLDDLLQFVEAELELLVAA